MAEHTVANNFHVNGLGYVPVLQSQFVKREPQFSSQSASVFTMKVRGNTIKLQLQCSLYLLSSPPENPDIPQVCKFTGSEKSYYQHGSPTFP
ncbi:hypothetical protein ABKN59_009320 [Abortiporus biennis]